MAVSDLITRARTAAGSVVVYSGGAPGAEFPVLALREEASVIEPVPGANGAAVVKRTFVVDSVAVAGGEAVTAVGTLKASLTADLVQRGQRVNIVEMGGAARVLRAGGDVSGISGAGKTTRPGWPVTSIAFDEQRSVGAVVFFTLTIETVEVTFGAADDGYNVVQASESRQWDEDARGGVSLRVSGSVALKPGQDAAEYVADVILGPARAAAEDDGDDFTSIRRRPGLDVSVCEYEYTRRPPSFGGGGGWTTATTIDETDVTERGVEGRVTRTISGSVTGPSPYAAAEARRLSPVPANHVFVSETISQPAVQGGVPGGRVTYSYRYQSGRAGSGALAGYAFFSWAQSVTPSGGSREALYGVFDNAAPVIGFGALRPVIYTEVTEFEFTGAGWPSAADIPRASGLDGDDEIETLQPEKSVSAAGVRRMRLTRRYALAAPLGGGTPNPVEEP